jgi:4-diphosphocytidyl-2-C-methyl-D-erythritol kinase
VVSADERPGIRFTCDDPVLPVGDDNLAVRAARYLLEKADLSENVGVTLHLAKKIPTAAGLGGGSSDAGTVLKGLNRLLGNVCNEGELLDLAVRLGADVPFFAVDAGCVVATGIGEKMEQAVPMQGFWVLLVNPGISVPTRWVFENLALTKNEKKSKMRGFLGTGARFALDQMHNDLESTTISRYPVVAEIKRQLLAQGADAAMMSGSGATVFGLFNTGTYTKDKENRLLRRFRSVYGRRVFSARPCAGV